MVVGQKQRLCGRETWGLGESSIHWELQDNKKGKAGKMSVGMHGKAFVGKKSFPGQSQEAIQGDRRRVRNGPSLPGVLREKGKRELATLWPSAPLSASPTLASGSWSLKVLRKGWRTRRPRLPGEGKHAGLGGEHLQRLCVFSGGHDLRFPRRPSPGARPRPRAPLCRRARGTPSLPSAARGARPAPSSSPPRRSALPAES